MLSNSEVIKQSLALHLFFARIMKEHAFFLEIGFSPKDKGLIQQANDFKKRFELILIEAVSLSGDVVHPAVLESGEVITPFTLKAEMSSSYFTGVGINTNITEAEIGLKGNSSKVCDLILEQKVKVLNHKVVSVVMSFISFKDKVLSDMVSCSIFTTNYPTLLEHVIEEAKFYLHMIQRLQACEEIVSVQQTYALEGFWNHVMADHATIIRLLLDPSEHLLIDGAEFFEEAYKDLSMALKEIEKQGKSGEQLTCQTALVTKGIQDFKSQATQGILECKIKSIMIPLLADHVLREANHYLRILTAIK